MSTDSGHFQTHLTPKQHAKVTSLVGKKCFIKCILNYKIVKALWDTGAQVSIVSEKFLKEMFPGLALKHISELVETELNLTMANGSSIPRYGWVELEFCISPEQQSLIVSFLVTTDDMDLPLIGFNITKEHLRPKNNDTNLSTLMVGFPTTKPSNVEALYSQQTNKACAQSRRVKETF